MSGPRFEFGEELAKEIVFGLEGEVGKGVFVGGDVICFEFEEVDDAEVDLADGVGVVVDEPDDGVGVVAVDVELFVDFAFDGSEVGGLSEVFFAGVHGVDMAADAEGALGVEAGFAGGFSTGVVEVAPLVVEDAVGDELFVGGVVFGDGAVHEEVVGGVEEGLDVVVRVAVEAFERAELVEEAAGDDEDFFACVFGHGAS